MAETKGGLWVPDNAGQIGIIDKFNKHRDPKTGIRQESKEYAYDVLCRGGQAKIDKKTEDLKKALYNNKPFVGKEVTMRSPRPVNGRSTFPVRMKRMIRPVTGEAFRYCTLWDCEGVVDGMSYLGLYFQRTGKCERFLRNL